ncbi:hypothetical protein DYB32_002191 [Aphanomyces invadans]|uniref:Bromo domain-containing protein n=1 Tax=Aphanomyces invadans TaxID=157072 RepID=A0A418B431_9STRA|nr:hypothetical protein DYB32_002191 [Aphanomyces invadans]
MEAEQKALCLEVLDDFFKLEISEPFRERVNWEEWGLYDYLQVVKTPMDMGTVRVKLNKGEYKKPEEFGRDMRLIWDNCKLYNQSCVLKLSKRYVCLHLSNVSNDAPKNADEIELNVDAIDAKAFKEIDAFIKDCVPGGALPRTLKKSKRKKDKESSDKSSKRHKE